MKIWLFAHMFLWYINVWILTDSINNKSKKEIQKQKNKERYLRMQHADFTLFFTVPSTIDE